MLQQHIDQGMSGFVPGLNFFSSSVIARLRRSRPQRTLSRASSNSSMLTAFLFVLAASNAASFNKLASSAPE